MEIIGRFGSLRQKINDGLLSRVTKKSWLIENNSIVLICGSRDATDDIVLISMGNASMLSIVPWNWGFPGCYILEGSAPLTIAQRGKRQDQKIMSLTNVSKS